MLRTTAIWLAVSVAHVALAAPVSYQIDPMHTYPSFETDHMGGTSVWRGKINHTTGKITMDRAAQQGTIEVVMDMSTINFGLGAMDDSARGAEILDVAKYPSATYKGRLSAWKGDTPTAVDGELTLHGVTRPLKLTINSLKCQPHPMLKTELCGADASAAFNRDDFGIDAEKSYGFLMFVRLSIQVEANQIVAKP
jgi:polyisoprenoid-binding protein YceI